MKYIFPFLLLLAFSSCKKDEDTNDSGSGTGNQTPAHYSTSIYTLDFTLQDIPYHFEFGENGYGFQYSSFFIVNGEDVFLTGSTSFTWNGDPKTTNIGYAQLSLPPCVIPLEEWQNNSAQSFLNYLAGDYPIMDGEDTDICTFSFVDSQGNIWATYNTSQSNSTSNSFGYVHAIDSDNPALAVNGGEATIALYNIADDITEIVNLTWNIRFQEPI